MTRTNNERWEVVNRHDAASAGPGREVIKFREAGVLVLEADKFQALPLLGGGSVVSDQHAESLTRLENFISRPASNLTGLNAVIFWLPLEKKSCCV